MFLRGFLNCYIFISGVQGPKVNMGLLGHSFKDNIPKYGNGVKHSIVLAEHLNSRDYPENLKMFGNCKP